MANHVSRVVPARSRDFTAADEKAGIVVRHVTKKSDAFLLKGMNRRIWQLTDGRRTAAEIVKEIADATGGDVSDDKILLALRQLADKGIVDLEIRDAPAKKAPASPARAEVRPVHATGVREQERDAGLLIQRDVTDTAQLLNESARAIWELCDGTRSPSEIAKLLEARLRLPRGTLRADVGAAVRQLMDVGFLNDAAGRPSASASASSPDEAPGLVPRKTSGIKERELDGELLIYFDKDQTGQTLNQSARAIWDLCDGKRTVTAIAGELERRLSLPEGALEPDVGAALDRLVDTGHLTLRRHEAVRSRAAASGASAADVDWRRMAEPQDDDYDIEAAIALFERRTGKTVRALEREANDASSVVVAGGDLALRHMHARKHLANNVVDAPLDHPNIGLALQYLRGWPIAYRHFRRLMNTFHPVWEEGVSCGHDGLLSGSQSHSLENALGTMWATIHCPLMLAEAFLHEMGHQKLFALGIMKETSHGLILNSRDEEYISPVIVDRRRPMAAVIHGEYVFTYVTQFDVMMIPQLLEVEASSERRARLRQRLQRNVDRIGGGVDEIKKHAKVDDDGRRFLEGFYDWVDRVVAEGRRALSAIQSTKQGPTYDTFASPIGLGRSRIGEAPRAESPRPRAETAPAEVKKPVDSRLVSRPGAVRVFVGTEPRMHKAEVALERSIRKHTSGEVEIVWMDAWRGGIWGGWDIGRERGRIAQEVQPGWTTEFSCFRFAIPEACGFEGRAIYLDVDMLALRDLRPLFEMEMTKPVHSTKACSACMLFDCSWFADPARWPRIQEMKPSAWNIDRYWKILVKHDAVGRLSDRWNCHDGEGYDPATTGILHFTRRNTQPWRPAPEVFSYRPHPKPELERLWWEAYHAATGHEPASAAEAR